MTLVCSQNAKTGELKYTGVTEENESVRMHVTKYMLVYSIAMCIGLYIMCVPQSLQMLRKF